MRTSITRIILAAVATLPTAAFLFAATDWSDFSGEVLIMGEVHDNPQHHAEQANAVRIIQPKAVVFEMLTPEEAQALAEVPRDPDAMRDATGSVQWSNIADYADVLAASPVIVGAALSREDMRAAFSSGAAEVFGAEAESYGLTQPLAEEEQAIRELNQFDAHCEAMPQEMMGGMVEAQRLRDAAFARSVIEALDTYGSPVVLITGNGHARMDWGVPAYLMRARPTFDVTSIGQGERQEPPDGLFSWTLNGAASPDRDDPCAVFKQ
ncbi:ChaN family lipoprotein [uncultured Tateyamaria sp.]|uniref:ChaN family lipoprotein n=1 Tax=uncultured Tateyamaria sp. TaxID=455651 RepID=UPI00262DB045|nr:ChaN family lipoprotein [uncultured Tateyamaria sp.]